MLFKLLSPHLTHRWITIKLCYFLVFGVIKLEQNGCLDGTCKFWWLSSLTMSDQLKEKLWIYHHQTFYMDIRWHKIGWYWFSAIFEKQDGHHSQFSSNIYTFIIDSSASFPVPMPGDSVAVAGNRRFLVYILLSFGVILICLWGLEAYIYNVYEFCWPMYADLGRSGDTFVVAI